MFLACFVTPIIVADNNQWCPGFPVSYTCNAASRLVWNGTLLTGQCSSGRINIDINDSPNALTCGQVNVTNIIVPDPNFPQLNNIQSTISFISGLELMGASIVCTKPLSVPIDVTLNLLSTSLFNSILH